MHSFIVKKYSAALVTFLFGASFFMNSCYYDNAEYLNGTACDTISVSFSSDIVPILEANCYSCHSIATGVVFGEGTILETYDELMASVSGASLTEAIDWTGTTSHMPKGGSQLPACERSLIRNWVDQGMLNN